jgi:hypothetical protein
MKSLELTKRIGKLTRNMVVETMTNNSGVTATIIDKPDDAVHPYIFDVRRFFVCQKYPSVEANILRAKRYYKML